MAIKCCWATNRRGSSLKGVMKLNEIGHDQNPVGVTPLDRQKNAVSPGWGLRWVCLGTVCGVVPLVPAVCGVRGWA